MTHSKPSWLEPSYVQTKSFAQKIVDSAVKARAVYNLVYYVRVEAPLSQQKRGLPRYGALIKPTGMTPVIPLLLEFRNRDPEEVKETLARIESAKEHIEALCVLLTWQYQGKGTGFAPNLTTRKRMEELHEVPYNFLEENFDIACSVCANIRPGPLYARMECLQSCKHLKILHDS